MKTLDDIKQDMSSLYDQVSSGQTDLKVAAELANIAGKYLKAEQLALAREVFCSGKNNGAPQIVGSMVPLTHERRDGGPPEAH